MRWFLGLAKNSAGYSLPISGTPCEVPEPKNTKVNDMRKFLLPNAPEPPQ